VTKRSGVVAVVRDTLFYSVGLVLRRGLGVLTLPIYARYLTAHEFGIIAIVATARDLLTVAFEVGTPNSSARFFYDCRTEAERRRLFGSLWIFLIGSSIALSLVAFTAGASLWNRIVADVPFYPYVAIALGTVLVSVTGILPRTIFRVTDRVAAFMTLALVQGVLTSAISVVLVLLGFGALGPLLGALAASTLFFSFSTAT
jgi:O-antigen/teichoic acid export membrane protein